MSSDLSSTIFGIPEDSTTNNEAGLPSPQSETGPDPSGQQGQTTHSDGIQEAVMDPDVPIASVEAPDPAKESEGEESDANSKSDSDSDEGSVTSSEITDMYNILRPSESPTSSVCGKIDKKMRSRVDPLPLRYAKEVTHQKIEDHGTLLKFLCDRLAYLEHEVETLRTGPRSVESESPSPPPVIAPQAFAITEFGDYQWMNRRLDGLDSHVNFVLEVQLVPDNTGIQARSLSREQENTSSGQMTAEQGYSPEKGPEISVTPFNLLPQRVRIKSYHIISCLRDVSKEIFPYNGHVVFLSPFKLFVRYEKQIREALEKAEVNAQAVHREMVTFREIDSAKSAEDSGANTKDLREGLGGSDDQTTTAAESTKDPPITLDIIESQWHFLSERCEHLRLLVQFLDGPMKPILDLYHSIRNGSASQMPFDYLWYLFEPGKDVMQPRGHWQLSRVLSFTGGREVSSTVPALPPPPGAPPPPPPLPPSSLTPPLSYKRPFFVDCYRWEFDGERFTPVVDVYPIKPYDGLRDITSLPIYPLPFNKKNSEIKMQLMARGEKFLSLTKTGDVVHRHYTGVTLESNCTSAEEIDSRIIIDQRLAILEMPIWKPEEYTSTRTAPDNKEIFLQATINDFFHVDHDTDKDAANKWFLERKHILEPSEDLVVLPDEEKILLPFFLYGFVLRSRKWAKLHVELITDIEEKNSFDDLVLPKGHARSIQALVENHNRGPGKGKETDHVDVAMDLVRGKGKGVIILLHGEPGVGKTSTAECIADYTSRPLYPITCGDIGETAEDVEKNLEKTFQFAHKWGCVLLLDEADIFLQERNKDDMRRNAVVSVFLRVLEYYSGILFLTTNRVGIIDQAFRSRIHLSLYYPALDKKATKTIWKMHLKNAKARFREKGQTLEVDKEEIVTFAKEQFTRMKEETGSNWNGRQIRNAFQTAIALAEYHARGKERGKKTKLTVDEFKTVQETSDSFDKYLMATQKASQAVQAKAAKTRADDFKTKETGAKATRKAKPRRKRDVEIEPEPDSTTSSESSDTEISSSEGDDESDGAGRNQGKEEQDDDRRDEDSDRVTERRKSHKGKDRKPTGKMSKKKDEVSSDEEERGKGKRKTNKGQEDISESEPEAKVKQGKGKKKATKAAKEEIATSSEPEVKAEKKRSRK